ncbi:hypothetical protein LXL04_016100 [Taraxacum kok-saghyz]
MTQEAIDKLDTIAEIKSHPPSKMQVFTCSMVSLFALIIIISFPTISATPRLRLEDSTTTNYTDFIKASCEITRYADLCFKTLSPFATAVRNSNLPWRNRTNELIEGRIGIKSNLPWRNRSQFGAGYGAVGCSSLCDYGRCSSLFRNSDRDLLLSSHAISFRSVIDRLGK